MKNRWTLTAVAATVNVQNSDLLPINRIDLQIYNTSDPAISITCPSLPLPQGPNQTVSGISQIPEAPRHFSNR